MDPLRIVLLGKTGVGKSATGNTILGGKPFGEHCSPESFTRNCSANDAKVDGRNVTVIDTPGLYDTSLKTRELKSRIEELFNNSGKGIHAILLVIKLCNRFTKEERNSVQWIKDNFGEEVSKNTIVLFTNGDELERNGIKIEDYINEGENLKNVIDQCDKRYQVFNNRANDRTQVTELLEKIRVMMTQNKKSLYTKKKYEKAQKKLFIANAVGCITGGLVGAVAGGTAAVAGAAVAGVAGGTAAVAGVAGGTAAVAGAVKGVVITAAVVGGVGTAVVFGALGVGAAVYTYFKSKQSAGEKNKEV